MVLNTGPLVVAFEGGKVLDRGLGSACVISALVVRRDCDARLDIDRDVLSIESAFEHVRVCHHALRELVIAAHVGNFHLDLSELRLEEHVVSSSACLISKVAQASTSHSLREQTILLEAHILLVEVHRGQSSLLNEQFLDLTFKLIYSVPSHLRVVALHVQSLFSLLVKNSLKDVLHLEALLLQLFLKRLRSRVKEHLHVSLNCLDP